MVNNIVSFLLLFNKIYFILKSQIMILYMKASGLLTCDHIINVMKTDDCSMFLLYVMLSSTDCIARKNCNINILLKLHKLKNNQYSSRF